MADSETNRALRGVIDDIDGVTDTLGDAKEVLDDMGRDDLEERLDSIITDLRELARSVAAEVDDEDVETSPDGDDIPVIPTDPAEL